MHEFAFIEQLLSPLAHPTYALGLQDDAAFLEDLNPAETLVISKDMLIEGVHFLPQQSAETKAHKALAVNLSDLAAKGARPLGYSLGLALPEAYRQQDWLTAFASGLRDLQKQAGCLLLGGDTTATPGPLVISITAYGTAPKGKGLRRSGAQPGEVLYVTGTLGGAAAALSILQQGGTPDPALLQQYERPTVRLAAGQALLEHATAALDISDGLLADAGHLARASAVGLEIDLETLPRLDNVSLEQAATGGDDYEILFTAPAAKAQILQTIAKQTATPITAIGRVTPNKMSVRSFYQGQEKVFENKGFQHF